MARDGFSAVGESITNSKWDSIFKGAPKEKKPVLLFSDLEKENEKLLSKIEFLEKEMYQLKRENDNMSKRMLRWRDK